MSRIHTLNINDPALAQKMADLQAQMMAQSPEHVKKLGKILRRRSTFFFSRYLKSMGLLNRIAPKDLPLFMDYLITQRLDLKDMAQESRDRLRTATLKNEPDAEKTLDYIRCVENSEDEDWPRCRNCHWFVQAPLAEKSCVEMGSKGIDAPCYGFTLK